MISSAGPLLNTRRRPWPQTLNNNNKKKQSAWCIRLVPRGPEFDPLLHVSVTVSDETLSCGPALLVILKLHTIINTLSLIILVQLRSSHKKNLSGVVIKSLALYKTVMYWHRHGTITTKAWSPRGLLYVFFILRSGPSIYRSSPKVSRISSTQNSI